VVVHLLREVERDLPVLIGYWYAVQEGVAVNHRYQGASAVELPEQPRAVVVNGSKRKAYVPPRLVRYGEIRTVTLGTSPGVGESGPSGTRNRPV
jgi:hypothetical protein